jgi:cysteinyl-tRNA synthetase
MAHELLGESFDIHGGGLDLQFPHHENEIAQSACAHPHGDFAHYWLHNEMLQVEGKKMSKSLGNFFTVRDLLEQGIPGEVIRFVLLMTHYRSPMDWTQSKAREAIASLREWVNVAVAKDSEPDIVFVSALADDLNTALALSRLHELFSDSEHGALTASAKILGLDLIDMKAADWAQPFERRELIEGLDFQPTVGMVGWGRFSEATVTAVLYLVRSWLIARWEKNWETADRIKKQAGEAGLRLQVDKTPNGHTSGTAVVEGSFDPAKLEALQ